MYFPPRQLIWLLLMVLLIAFGPACSKRKGLIVPAYTKRIFPATDPWNEDISQKPLDPNSSIYIAAMGPDKPLHPDYGTFYKDAPLGIPYILVPGNQPPVPVQFEYANESDPGPYPIPPNAPIEGGPQGTGDRHVIVIDKDNDKLYELYNATPVYVDGKVTLWKAGSGAKYDMAAGTTRPLCWTSADAAGLPIFPGLVRYDETVLAGEIKHALRFTVKRTRRGFVAPARHFASKSTDPFLPPMGLRVRLKASYDISGFPREAQVVLTALKKYGMILADNGGDWFLSGATDPRWDDGAIKSLRQVKGSDFEVVKMDTVVTECQ